MELEDVGLGADPLDDRVVVRVLAPLGESHEGEGGVRAVHGLGVEHGRVARYDPSLLELPNPFVDRGTREAHFFRDRGMGHASVLAKEGKDLSVDPIELGGHIATGPSRTNRPTGTSSC